MATSNLINETDHQIDLEEAQLIEEYEQLAIKYHKQQLILSTMKEINCDDINDVDETGKKNINKALDFVRAFDYLKMDKAGTMVLGNLVKCFFFIMYSLLQTVQ